MESDVRTSSTDAVRAGGVDVPTRERVTRLLLEHGPQTAATLSEQLDLSVPAVRRHLDVLAGDGLVTSREQSPRADRGPGRPARVYLLTDAGRETFPHAYDDLAVQALRFIRGTRGEAAIREFARSRLSVIPRRYGRAVSEAGSASEAAETLASALTKEGYAAEASQVPTGNQVCQHHCPVGHVAAEFPELCEAETEMISEMVGTHVQRLATIAHGDGICTTHIPATDQPANAASAAPRDSVTAPDQQPAPSTAAPSTPNPRRTT